jgi:hypothetical protein
MCAGAGAAVIAFSTTDRASFEAVASWVAKVTAECGDIAMALVQNKCDLLDQVGCCALSPAHPNARPLPRLTSTRN